ncbi:N-acetyltransferase [Bacteroidia bacterium]|nr:N-acetyltransferase [Bacteroidia bacterium]GHT45327.1 N-acetyltransferase [Bacteroidia bacterium]
MGFLREFCTIFPLDEETLSQCQTFSCGDKDLDDFFLNDADNYNRQLLGKSYCYRLNADLSVIVCAFTLSNSGIDSKNLPGSRRKKLTENIPHEKHLTSYPSTLIGRLGVNKEYAKKGIGTKLMDFIKMWVAAPENKNGCRYLTVDAYNNESTKKYYETNGFQTLFSTEKQEKDSIGLPDGKELKTRLMYFDLIRLLDYS